MQSTVDKTSSFYTWGNWKSEKVKYLTEGPTARKPSVEPKFKPKSSNSRAHAFSYFIILPLV